MSRYAASVGKTSESVCFLFLELDREAIFAAEAEGGGTISSDGGSTVIGSRLLAADLSERNIQAGKVTSLLDTDEALLVSLVELGATALFKTEAMVDDRVRDASILSESFKMDPAVAVRSPVDSDPITVELLKAVLKSTDDEGESCKDESCWSSFEVSSYGDAVVEVHVQTLFQRYRGTMFVFRVWSGIFRNRDQQRTFLDDPHIVVDIQLPGMNDVELHGKQRQREAFGEEFKQLKSVLLSLADHHVTA